MEKILAILENHFDQVWRRCFKRDFENDGNTYISYEKIEKMYIDRCIEIAQKHPEFKFQIETAVVVDTYIKNNPEKKDILRELYKKRQLRVCDSGYYITDSNMISIESFITNFLLSDRFFKELFGEISPVVTRRDAFGNSAQLPQVFKSLHKKSVIGISYSTAKGDVWQGIDKSAVCVKNPPFAGGAGGWRKLVPCPECKGKGCKKCDYTGVDRERERKDWWNLTVYPERILADEITTIMMGGEELTPAESLVDEVNALKSKYPVEFGFNEDYLPYIEDINAKLDCGDFSGLSVHPSFQINFNNTGCYVSRIKTKQRLIETENTVSDLEVLAAKKYVSTGEATVFSEIYKHYLFGAFHDSVAGTMVDAAYDEIMAAYDSLSGKIEAVSARLTDKTESSEKYFFNGLPIKRNAVVYMGCPNGKNIEISGEGVKTLGCDGKIATVLVENIEPYGARAFKITEADNKSAKATETAEKVAFHGTVLDGADEGTKFSGGEKRVIGNSRYAVTINGNGVESIYDKILRKTVCAVGAFSPFEHVLETDIGSPWTTLENYFNKTRLRDYTRLVGVTEKSGYAHAEFRTAIPNSMSGESNDNVIEWKIALIDGVDEILYSSRVEWHNFNRRLKVAFPATGNGEAFYSAPGAVIPAEKYEPYFSWSGASGDYPAYRFAAVEADGYVATVFNAGTPSFGVEKSNDGAVMFVSILRSPTVPTYLHEPQSYTMKAWDGMRDNGSHEFRLALKTYEKRSADIVLDAEAFAHSLAVIDGAAANAELPIVKEGKAVITRVKPAYDGDGIIVRLIDENGDGGETTISLPAWVKSIKLTDVAENEKRDLPTSGKTLTLTFRPFEIKTLKLKRGK